MGAGANTAGFASGFGRGLANALLKNRDRADAKTKEEQARKDRMFQTMLPVLLENIEDPADLGPMLEAQFPGSTKGKKGQPSTFDKLSQFLGPLLKNRGPKIGGGTQVGQPQVGNDLPSQGGITGNMPVPRGGRSQLEMDSIARRRQLGLPVAEGVESSMPVAGPAVMAAAAPAAAPPQTSTAAPGLLQIGAQALPDPSGKPTTVGQLPGGPAAASTPKPQRTLMGVPIMSHADKIKRDLDDKTQATIGLMERARDVVLPTMRAIDPSATLEDALRVLGITIPADRLQGQVTNYGVDREALSRAVFGKNFKDLSQEQQQVVIQEEQKQLTAEAKARGIGTGQANFERPADLETAQKTGVAVGTTAADVAGQTVPQLDVQAQRREITALRGEITRVQDLLGALPTASELGGLAPGAVLSVRRRMNTPSTIPDGKGGFISQREAVARLESVIDGMATTLARSRGQRGAQTERDAERAYNALVQLKAGLTDPFGGDTRESATARIEETIAALLRMEELLAAAPVKPAADASKTPAAAPKTTPQTTAVAATSPAKTTPAKGAPARNATGNTGMKMDANGNITDANGNILFPAN